MLLTESRKFAKYIETTFNKKNRNFIWIFLVKSKFTLTLFMITHLRDTKVKELENFGWDVEYVG